MKKQQRQNIHMMLGNISKMPVFGVFSFMDIRTRNRRA